MFLRVRASNIPIQIADPTKEEPPLEMSGKAIPFVGPSCRVDAMFINACKPKLMARPQTDKVINMFDSFMLSIIDLITIVP